MSRTGDEPSAASGLALFALGFRPFFLVAMLAPVPLLVIWVFAWRGALAFPSYYGVMVWHAHEMLFGYTTAVIAGFLLTAVRNWTNSDTLTGAGLAALVLLWLAGRVAPFLEQLTPAWTIGAVDLAFLPVLTVSLAIPLLRQAPSRNLMFVPVLIALALANALVHAERLGFGPLNPTLGVFLGVDITVLLIAIIGGRVLPFFSERALPGAAPRKRAWLEPIAIGSIVALACVRLVSSPPWLLGAVAALAAAAHALRLAGWHERRVWSVPLLWVLYLGYGWMVMGLGLTACAAAGWFSPLLALHALTAGAIGVMTIGMMARVALGHTGRPLQPAALTVAAFVVVNVAAALRVFASLAAPERYADLVVASGLLWALAFALLLTAYAGILVRPRLDGRPG
jgi:uncharacterized protein involved in response to NO